MLLILHGIARAWLGIVDDFGGFLDSLAFPRPPREAPILTRMKAWKYSVSCRNLMK